MKEQKWLDFHREHVAAMAKADAEFIGYERQGTAYDPDARGYELVGRKTKPTKCKRCGTDECIQCAACNEEKDNDRESDVGADNDCSWGSTCACGVRRP